MKNILITILLSIVSVLLFHSCKAPDPVEQKKEGKQEKSEKSEESKSDTAVKVKTPAEAYLDSGVILWTLSTEELERYLHVQVEPVEMPMKDRKSRFLVKYLSFNDVGFDSLYVYESDSVKRFLHEEQVVAVVGCYFNLVQEKNSKRRHSDSGTNIANLMFLGTPVKISGTGRR